MSDTRWHPKPTERKCTTCGSLGFSSSPLGPPYCSYCDGTEGGNPPTIADCADRIETLIAEREVWKDRAMQVQDERDGLIGDLNATEAKLAKAVEALGRIARQPDYRLPSPQGIAQEALAEIKGESHD